MKIFCIGRNYAAHAKELNHPIPEEPVFFMKPDSAIIRNNRPFFLPDFSSELHHEVEIVLKICRLGRNIDEKYAYRYYNELGIGIDFTARDLQRKAIKQGNPWEISKAFDGSAPVSKFIKKEKLPNLNAINFQLNINGKTVQKGNTKDLIFSFDELIAYISRFVTFKMGDLIFTGTPPGVGPVKIGDQLSASIEGKTMLEFFIK